MALGSESLHDEKTVYPESVTCDGICEGHDHPRDLDEDGDGRAEMLVPMMAEIAELSLGMGNTIQPVNTSARARIQKDKWQHLVPEGKPLRYLVAGLLSKNVDPADIVAGFDKPDGEEDWDAMKVFMHGVSNDQGNSVRHFSEVMPQIRAMTRTKWKHKDRKMPLLIHLERKYEHVYGNPEAEGKRIMILEREYEALLTDLEYLCREEPEIDATIEHVSDHRTIEKVGDLRSKGYNLWGGIAPHYGQYSIDDLFEGPAFNSHLLCWPLFKTEKDRQAADDAMLSGADYLYIGTDRACQPNNMTLERGAKISKSGKVMGGQSQIPEAVISYVIERFFQAGKSVADINRFVSHNGMRRFGRKPQTKITFKRENWVVPHTIERQTPDGNRIECVIAMGGQSRKYRVAA